MTTQTHPAPFRAAVVQTLASLGDVNENIRLLEHYTREAVRRGAKLVVFPECMNTGYLFDSIEHARDLAEPLDGPFATTMKRLARQHGLHIASGFTELGDNGEVFNSGVLFDPSGSLILHYQKQFLATHDQNWFDWGQNGCPVVDTELGRLGLLICFDGRIPEIARTLALQDVDVVVDMANFFTMDQADLWTRTRAWENGVWIVAGTKAGVERSIYYPGGSMIVDPEGHVHAYMNWDDHGVACAEVDPMAARNKRWEGGGDRFQDRRPDLYGILAQPLEDTPAGQILNQPIIPSEATSKTAAVQAHMTTAEGSLQAALEMVEHAARLGVKLIALPQFANAEHWLPEERAAREAAERTNTVLEYLAGVCSRWSCTIVAPLVERDGEKLFSTAFVIGPGGAVQGKYQQTHVEPECRGWCEPGDTLPVFETDWGRFGVLLGYDGRFPETARALALKGADAVVWAAGWRDARDRTLLTAPKAEDNRVFLVAANRTDTPYPGGSFVIQPTGLPDWNVDRVAPRQMRHGAVMPGFMNLALARQKMMIPGVDMLANRFVKTYSDLVKSA